MKKYKILVTGAAGFIGFHLAKGLLERGDEVIGLDNINSYYDINLKYSRLAETGIAKEDIEHNKLAKSNKYRGYKFIKMNLEEKENILKLFEEQKFDKICHLAAQAGVRYSLENADAYIQSNIVGFFNILEGCRHYKIKHLVFAGSSSVYGLNEKMPFSPRDNVDHPISLYAASKKSDELMAHSYSYLYNIPITGLRFFTVYGPWGRPDMALFKFTAAIIDGKPIDVYNYGKMIRDFTYIDDVIEGTIMVLDNPPKGNSKWTGMNPDPSSSKAPYRIYNIGNSHPIQLIDFIEALQKALKSKAKLNYLPLQQGDVVATHADVTDLKNDFNYSPDTSIELGIKKFIDWYTQYSQKKHNLSN